MKKLEGVWPLLSPSVRLSALVVDNDDEGVGAMTKYVVARVISHDYGRQTPYLHFAHSLFGRSDEILCKTS